MEDGQGLKAPGEDPRTTAVAWPPSSRASRPCYGGRPSQPSQDDVRSKKGIKKRRMIIKFAPAKKKR